MSEWSFCIVCFYFTLVLLININKISTLVPQLHSFINDMGDFLIELDSNQVYSYSHFVTLLLEIEL